MSPLDVSNREVLGYLGCGGALLLIYSYVLFRLDRKIRAKGYQSPFRSLGMTLAFLVSFGMGGYFAALAPGICWQCTPADNPGAFQPALIGPHIRQFVGYFSAGSAIPILLVVAIAFVLPRHSRRFGERRVRMPWKASSRFFLILMVLWTLVVGLGHVSFETWFKLTTILYLGYSGSAYLAKRVAAHGMEKVLEDDPRPPVFYLREFLTEDERFTTLSYDECTRLGVPVISLQAWRHPATLEQYFDVEIRQRIGPLVALGDPNDYVPPGGAAREYFADEQWMAKFRDLAGGCRFLIMRAGESANLQRELRMLRELSLLDKLFIVTAPERYRHILPKAWATYSERRTWLQFLRLIAAAGLTGCQYPGRGAVVSFDSEGAVVVRQGATSPAQYVAAILGRIDEFKSTAVQS